MKNVGIIGSGIVAQTLGKGFLSLGYSVMLGSRNASKLEAWQAAAGPQALIGTFREAAQFGELLVLSVKGNNAMDALHMAGTENIAGKVIIDTTNPLIDQAPQDGVLEFFTDSNDSLMEQLQDSFLKARFVKAFNSVGNACMVHPQFSTGKPCMFICGNDEAARQEVSEILNAFGWQVEDMGTAVAARAIEPLCILWCIPGFLRGEWNHAFSVLHR